MQADGLCSSTSSSRTRCGTRSSPRVSTRTTLTTASRSARRPPPARTGAGCSICSPRSSDTGRMAVVLDTGAVSRGSGNQGSNRERDIRKAFVEARPDRGGDPAARKPLLQHHRAGRDYRHQPPQATQARNPAHQRQPTLSPKADPKTTSMRRISTPSPTCIAAGRRARGCPP